MNIKEIALKIARNMADFPIEHKPYEYQIKFAEALVAELAKENEPVARICSGWQLLFIGSDSIAEVARKRSLKIGDALYTLPPTAEQIEQETAEACINACRDSYANGDMLLDAINDLLQGKWREYL